MYYEGAEGALNAALFVCPTTQSMDMKTRRVEASGRCHIVAPRGNVFAKFSCKGEVGACEGKFELTGGTDELQGITGSGPMQVRAVLQGLNVDTATGETIRSGKGLALWPKFKIRLPQR